MLRKIRHLTKYFFLLVTGALLLAIIADFGTKTSGRNESPEALTVDGEGVGFEVLQRAAESYQAEIRADGLRSETEIPHAAMRRAAEEITDRLVVMALADDLGTKATDEEITREFYRRYATRPDGTQDRQKFENLRRNASASELRPIERQLAEEITYLKTYLTLASGPGVSAPMLLAYHDARYGLRKIRQYYVCPADLVSADAARASYDAQPDTFFLPERADFRALLFAPLVAGPPGELEARERAIRASLAARSAPAFDALYRAIESDTDPSTEVLRRTDVPRVTLGAFETTVWQAPAGVPTEPIPAGGGAFAILLTDRRAERSREPFEKVERAIRESLAGPEEWAEARARIHAVADRPDSVAFLAGAEDLGWLVAGEVRPEDYPDTRARERILGTLVPPQGSALDRRIEAALLTLEPGRPSAIVRTRRGYHLLYLEARKPADPTAAPRRLGRLRDDLLRVFRQGTFNALVREARNRYAVKRNDYLQELLSE